MTQSLFEKITLLSTNLPPVDKDVDFAAAVGGRALKTTWHRGHITNVFSNGDISVYYPATKTHVIIRFEALVRTVWRYQDSRSAMDRAADNYLASKGIVAENATELQVARMMFAGGLEMAYPPAAADGCDCEEHC